MTTETARAETARQRGLQARVRAAELADRRRRIRGQRSASPDDVASAQLAAQVALERSSAALARAIEAHRRSGDVHRRVAEMYDAKGDVANALLHRRAADDSDRAARRAEIDQRLNESAQRELVEPPTSHPGTLPCPRCGSAEPFSVSDRIVLCADCGHVWQAWTDEACRHHLWVTGDGDSGRPDLEQHCAVCGEVRLIPREQL